MSFERCNAVIRVRRTAGITRISTCRGDASDDNGTPVETTMPVPDRRNDPVSEMRRPFAIRLASDLPGLRTIVAVAQRLVDSFRR